MCVSRIEAGPGWSLLPPFLLSSLGILTRSRSSQQPVCSCSLERKRCVISTLFLLSFPSAGKDATDEDVEKMLEDGKSPSVFVEGVRERGGIVAKRAVAGVTRVSHGEGLKDEAPHGGSQRW